MPAQRQATIAWLMEGDPAIRWQTLRDLLDAPAQTWQAEQLRTLEHGWGARLLALQEPLGGWGGGIYSPKWISTTYTLLALRAIGIPRNCEAAQRGTRLMLKAQLGESCDALFLRRLADCDRCVVGMMLQLGVYFMVADERIEAMVKNLLDERMPDGAWNCRRLRKPRPHHSSFHTTINVLEGLRDYLDFFPGTHRTAVLEAEGTALELLLQHYMFKSDKSGEVIDKRFTMLSFPPRWHYDVLRGLEYFAHADRPGDARLEEAIALLCDKQRSDGTWPVQHKYSGKVFFDMEKTGAPSRWNTLRALRVLRWWGADH